MARKIVESYLDHGDPLPDALKIGMLGGAARSQDPFIGDRMTGLPGSDIDYD